MQILIKGGLQMRNQNIGGTKLLLFGIPPYVVGRLLDYAIVKLVWNGTIHY